MRRGLLLSALAALWALPAFAGGAAPWIPDRVAFHAFLSQGLLASSHNDYLNRSTSGDWAFNEAALNVRVQVDPEFTVGAQVFTRDLGRLGNHRVDLDWATLDWRPTDQFGLRGGKFKLPYGLYNETADVDAVRTPVLLPQGVYNLEFRDFLNGATGADAYGSFVTDQGLFSYEMHAGWSFFRSDGSVARTLNDAGGGLFTVTELAPVFGAGAALDWETPWSGLRLRATYHRFLDGDIRFAFSPAAQSQGLPPASGWRIPHFAIHVLSAEYLTGPWTLAGEYSRWNGDFENSVAPLAARQERAYLQAARRVNLLVELGAYYSWFYPDRGDRDGRASGDLQDAFQKDMALSVRVDVTPQLILKVEGHEVDGTASVSVLDNPGVRAQRWRYLATKLSVAF